MLLGGASTASAVGEVRETLLIRVYRVAIFYRAFGKGGILHPIRDPSDGH